MNTVDIIFVVLLLYALMRGYTKGLLGTAAGYVAPVLGFMLAADWSDLVRGRIAEVVPAPDAILDILAPLVVFVIVVAVVRLAAAFAARLLGVGLSVPSRVVAAAATAVVSAVVLGSFIVLVRQMKAPEAPPGRDAGHIIASPFQHAISELDGTFESSRLGPPLAELASAVVTEAVEHKDDLPLPSHDEIEAAARKAAAAAAQSMGRIPIPVPDQQRSGGNGR